MGGKEFAFDIRSSKQLNRRIDCLRYTLTSITVSSAILAVVIFAYCLWMKIDPKFYEWIEQLHLAEFYIGIYIILFGSVIMMISSCSTCLYTLTDNSFGMKVMLGIDALVYLLCVIGSAVLLNYSTRSSPVQTKIKDSMLELISRPSYAPSTEVLRSIQESMGCCGATGANDYVINMHPLMAECRDSVTGSAYLYGCSEVLTSFLGEKCGWLAGIAMLVCLITGSFMCSRPMRSIRTIQERKLPAKLDKGLTALTTVCRAFNAEYNGGSSGAQNNFDKSPETGMAASYPKLSEMKK